MKITLNIIVLFCFLMSNANGQSLVINEVMSDNESSIADEDGGYSDYIEIFNKSQSPIILSDYSLSDDGGLPTKWTFPDVVIAPSDYVLVFASGKDRLDTNELHTNFKIDSDGEGLYLSKLGTVIDQISSVSLNANQAYVRLPDGSENWTKTTQPSPSTTNNESNPFAFSHAEGFYQTDFELVVEPFLDHTIYYTLNGDIPTPQSTILTESILISNRSDEPNFFSEIRTSPTQDLISYHAWVSPSEKLHKATIIRCASYQDGVLTSPIYTQTYFVDPDMSSKYTLPIVSLVTQGENLFDDEMGIYVPGIHLDQSNPEFTGNYTKKGVGWERDVHITYFKQDGQVGFSQDAGIRIHGGKTRHAAQKSLRLYARSEYGLSEFNYPLLPQKDEDTYKRFILRTTMGAWGKDTMIKDAVTHSICSDLNIEYQDYQPVIVYINGEYWGVHTIRDRIDKHYLSYSSGVDKDSIEIKEWVNTDYDNLIDFIQENDLSLNGNYAEVLEEIDIENYIDYTISELFFSNYDWPANNIGLWRKIPNGKWRWILFDLDGGFRSHDFDMLEHTTLNDSSVGWPNNPKSTFLFRHLLKSELFQQQFLSRYAELLNTDFRTDVMLDKLSTIKATYLPELASHAERWHFPNNVSTWEADVKSDLENYLIDRPCFVRRNLILFFDLSDFGFDCNPLSLTNAPDILLFPNPNNGTFLLWNNYQYVEDVSIRVYNLNGKLIHIQEFAEYQIEEKITIQLPDVPSGMYIVSIESPEYKSKKRVLVID